MSEIMKNLYFVSTLEKLSWEENEIFLISARLQELKCLCLYFQDSSTKALQRMLKYIGSGSYIV